MLGASAAPAFAGGEQAVLAIDAGGNITVTFEAGDNTQALAAKRINYAFGLSVADTDTAACPCAMR